MPPGRQSPFSLKLFVHFRACVLERGRVLFVSKEMLSEAFC